MPLIALLIAVLAIIGCFEAIRRGAFGEYAWAGYLIIFVICLVVLINVTGLTSHINLGRV